MKSKTTMILLTLVFGFFITGAVAVLPLSLAKARNMDARNVAVSRIAEAEAAAAAETAILSANERAAISPLLVFFGKVSIITLVVVVIALGGAVVIVVTAVAHTHAKQNQEIARLPAARQIAERVYIFRGEDGHHWLLDSMTGRRALLSNSADVDIFRAEIVREQTILQELGKTAVKLNLRNHNVLTG